MTNEDINAFIDEHLFQRNVVWVYYHYYPLDTTEYFHVSKEDPGNEYINSNLAGKFPTEGVKYKSRRIDFGLEEEWSLGRYTSVTNYDGILGECWLAEQKLESMGLTPVYMKHLLGELGEDCDLFEIAHAGSDIRAMAIYKTVKHWLEVNNGETSKSKVE